MNNTRTERIAIHESARIFSKFNWMFREQIGGDFGVDAIAEKISNGKPDGSFIALQIKGSAEFRHDKKGLYFYFSTSHYDYWLSVAKGMPFFFIFCDLSNQEIYWQQLLEENIKQTNKNWKLEIPWGNKLNIDAFTHFEKVVNTFNPKRKSVSHKKNKKEIPLIPKKLSELDIQYYLEKNTPKLLCCKIDDGETVENIKLEYIPTRKNWIPSKNELSWEDPYYFTLLDLKKYLKSRYVELKNKHKKKAIPVLSNEIQQLVNVDGIDGIARKMFDLENSKLKIPEYEKFIQAFQHHSKLKKGEFTAQTVGYKIYFHTTSDEFEMDTYEGKTALLRDFITHKSYDEIYTETSLSIWSEIYLDAGIDKEDFVPLMLHEWERYWTKLYDEILNTVGSTDHLDDSKDKSWRQLQVFINSYQDIGDIIEFSYKLDDLVLYPIAVITMMNIFDPEVCYEEYCELEFWSGHHGWEHINVKEEDDNYPYFHIRLSDL